MAIRPARHLWAKADASFAREVVRRSEAVWNTQVRQYSSHGKAGPGHQAVVLAPPRIATSPEHLDAWNAMTQRLRQKPMAALGLRKYIDQLDVLHPLYVQTLKQRAVSQPQDFLQLARMFIAACEAPLGMIALGNSAALWWPSTVHNFGPAYVGRPITPGLNNERWARQSWKDDPREVAIYQQLLSLPPGVRSGSIMFDSDWSIAANDAFVIGAAAEGLQMHIATVDCPVHRIPAPLLFTEGRPTVLAREAVLAAAMGYRRHDHAHPSLGLVLTRQDRSFEPRLDAAFEIMPQLHSPGDVEVALKEVTAAKRYSVKIPSLIGEALKDTRPAEPLR